MNNKFANNIHIPVLLDRSISYLPIKNKLNVIDATFGGGSYSKKIIEKFNVINLIAIDRDPDSIKYKKNIKSKKNFKLIEDKFSNIDKIVLDFMSINKIIGFDAIFFDFGLSSNQLEDIDRGFSFNIDSPLDMRMDKKGLSAYDLVNKFNEKDIADIIYKYGEERFANSIEAKKGITTRISAKDRARTIKIAAKKKCKKK